MKKNRHSLRPAGFTLVELLVVISIVAALAALLFLLGGKAVKMSHAAKSVSNLKNIGTGMTSLLQDGTPGLGKGVNYFPSYAGIDGEGTPYVWPDLVGQALGIVEKRDGKYVWLQPGGESVFQNPGHKTKFDNASSPPAFAKTSSYGYNYAGLGEWSSPSHRVQGDNPKLGNASILTINRPERTVVIAESDGNGIAAHLVWPYWKDAGVTDMYKGGGHYLFVDGHVELLRKKEVMDNLNKYFRPDL